MAKNRAAAEKVIYDYILKITNKENVETYKRLFGSMNDKAFDEFMSALASGEKYLCVYIPNFSDTGVSVERNLQIARELGYEFYQRIWIGSSDGSPEYLTPVPYMVFDLPCRRASQMLRKKIRIPESNRHVDQLSGQVTNESKGAAITYPELQILSSMGLDQSVTELIKYRGGDKRGFAAMNSMVNRFGKASLKSLANFATGVESTKTLSMLLTSAHLKNNL